MKDIRIDVLGRQRCWYCGSPSGFTQKRTARAKVVGGVAGVATLGIAGAAVPLATKKKLKCQSCGEYNQTGSAKKYTGPANNRAARKAGTPMVDEAMQLQVETTQLELKRIEAERQRQREEERQIKADQKAAKKLAKAQRKELKSRPLVPAGWLPDPDGRHEYRYWDGTAWTLNVSDNGVTSTDALIAEPA